MKGVFLTLVGIRNLAFWGSMDKEIIMKVREGLWIANYMISHI